MKGFNEKRGGMVRGIPDRGGGLGGGFHTMVLGEGWPRGIQAQVVGREAIYFREGLLQQSFVTPKLDTTCDNAPTILADPSTTSFD